METTKQTYHRDEYGLFVGAGPKKQFYTECDQFGHVFRPTPTGDQTVKICLICGQWNNSMQPIRPEKLDNFEQVQAEYNGTRTNE